MIGDESVDDVCVSRYILKAIERMSAEDGGTNLL